MFQIVSIMCQTVKDVSHLRHMLKIDKYVGIKMSQILTF